MNLAVFPSCYMACFCYFAQFFFDKNKILVPVSLIHINRLKKILFYYTKTFWSHSVHYREGSSVD